MTDLNPAGPIGDFEFPLTPEALEKSVALLKQQLLAQANFGRPTPIPEWLTALTGKKRVRYTPQIRTKGRNVDKRKLRRIRRERGRWLQSIQTHCPKENE